MDDVTRIEFVIYVGGRKREAIFVRRKKVADLLADPGSLGEFLRDAVLVPSEMKNPDPDRELPDVSELDVVWDRPDFQFESTVEVLRELKIKMGSLPAALACLVAASHICLDEGQDEFELLKAARSAFKRAREERVH